jgi:flagellar hook assembly protein FlgD
MRVIVARSNAINDGATLPSDFALHQNYPNPFNAQTLISFTLASPGDVRLDIYDITGRLVKTLLSRTLDYGNHQLIWNGTDNREQDVASGVYFYKLSADNKSTTKRMLLLR